MKLIRDNLEFMEALVPIIAEPRSPSTPVWEMSMLCRQLLTQLSDCEKKGKEKPDTLNVQSSLDAKEFQEFLELLGFNVEEVTEEQIAGSANSNYHVQLK